MIKNDYTFVIQCEEFLKYILKRDKYILVLYIYAMNYMDYKNRGDVLKELVRILTESEKNKEETNESNHTG